MLKDVCQKKKKNPHTHHQKKKPKKKPTPSMLHTFLQYREAVTLGTLLTGQLCVANTARATRRKSH